jgi:hypothetical protein
VVDPTTAGLTFAAVYAALHAAHGLGDVWVQRHHHALTKGAANRHGRAACAMHVTTYTLTTTVAVMLVWALPLGTHTTWSGLAAGQVFSAVTHYAIDRRWTLLALANLLGKREFHDLGQPRPLTVTAHKRVPVTSPAGTSHDEVTEVVVPLDNPVHATGATSLDQTLHHAALFIAALLTALI